MLWKQILFLIMNSMSLGMPSDPTGRTLQPIVTGASVLALKYKDGVMMAADTQASYGSLARYKTVERIKLVGYDTLLGASGEISDFQAISDMLDDLKQDDMNQDDGYRRSPKEIYSYLRAIMYQRRGKGNPLWNQLLVGGCRGGKSFLGYVDLIGTAYEENFICTGFGSYLAIPLIREKWREDMSEAEAKTLLEDCLRVLFYRDCRASNKIIVSKATEQGVVISEPYEISHNWDIATFDVRHTAVSTGGW
jgi:20S proteasome subunit beta 7